MSFERELAAVHGWVRGTSEIALEHFRPDLPWEAKSDGTPVTIADRAIESFLRERIADEFPGDAILGEEEGLIGDGPRRWILDPIDGTKNYLRGVPIFATLIALQDEQGLALAFVDAPALHAQWWATRGGGAFRNGDPIHVSGIDSLTQAHLASGGLETIREQGYLNAVVALSQKAARHRGFGDFWGHVLVAQGSLEAMIDPMVSTWDLAAVRLIVEQAGGRFTSLGGVESHDAGSGLSTNGLLHDEILSTLGGD